MRAQHHEVFFRRAQRVSGLPRKMWLGQRRQLLGRGINQHAQPVGTQALRAVDQGLRSCRCHLRRLTMRASIKTGRDT